MDAQELEDGQMSKPRASQLLEGLQPGAEINAAKGQIEEVWKEFYATGAGTLAPQDERLMSSVQVLTWED